MTLIITYDKPNRKDLFNKLCLNFSKSVLWGVCSGVFRKYVGPKLSKLQLCVSTRRLCFAPALRIFLFRSPTSGLGTGRTGAPGRLRPLLRAEATRRPRLGTPLSSRGVETIAVSSATAGRAQTRLRGSPARWRGSRGRSLLRRA